MDEIQPAQTLESIANTVEDGIYRLDSAGRFVAVNDRVVEVTGYDRSRLLGTHVSLLLDDATIDRIERRIRDLLRTGDESATLELEVRTATDDTIPCELRLCVLLSDGGFAGTVGVVRDISGRLERERELKRRSAMVESAMDGIGFSDETGQLRYVNSALADLYGYDTPDALIGSTWHVLFPPDEVRRLEEEALPTVLDRGYWRGEAVGKRADGSRFHQDHSLTALGDGIVCLVRDITAQKTREHQLEALNGVVHELMRVELPEEITQIGIDAVENVLDFEFACVRLLDRDANRLDCVALTDGAQDLLETQVAYDLDATLAGHAFRREEILTNVVSEADSSESASILGQSSVHVPIGSYGVLSLFVHSDDPVDDSDIYLTEMVATDLEAALARADRTRLLRTQDRELRHHHHQLETLTRITAINTAIHAGLVAATTREELDRMVCDELVESELYRSAWIGLIDGPTDRIGKAVGAGVEANYLTTITNRSLSGIADGTVERAIETKKMQVTRQYKIAGIDGVSESESDSKIEAIAAVPLLYGDRVVGVLVINSGREDVFSADAIGGFETLGKLIGFAKNALKSRELLLSDAVVELEFTVRDPAVFYTQLTEELDCRCEFERAVPTENGRIITYDTITGTEPESVLELAENAPTIEQARVVSEGEDSFILQSVTSHSLVQSALEAGTTVRSAVAEDGAGTIVIEAPQTADVRQIVASFERAFPAFDLTAKRERERSVMTAPEFRDSVAEQLTEKQRTALEAAYLTGYYDWPRKITAEELADSMEISSATLHQHLRKGGRCLLSAFFDDSAQ
ncbi:bacterio-opsin activator domain-containing protein [Natronolimnohabitans innermongolicus]|uniref:Bacterio-opsin activator-like protein n=1 Tax=Natronolimnohabitans innermongolicus JCM 12255 TaxID=1227499 RepID=L9XKH5_9EURY|nr:bacterio-opsin activator domain-containing protein [Natronolimnohabitans innermongolicus]ELY61133.1 bacterio-opsin activator-like protein [Natronolimnohabitans innermongolicus JCM 12255]